MKYLTLNNGLKLPEIGYGTYKTPSGDVCVNGVKTALKTGYRLIDTAAFYQNEASVKEGIIDSEVDRNDIFLTTKLWNSDQGYDNTLRAFDLSMKNLGEDVLDLYLIHWPIAFDYRERWQTTIRETWRAFEKLYKEGRVRAIGVSNFQIRHLKYLLSECEIAPMVDQIELHIGYAEDDVVNFCRDLGIVVEAWAPLARAKAFELPEVQAVAKSSGLTPSQVLIKWCMQKGAVPLPKSITPSRIEENFGAINGALTDVEMGILDSVTAIGRLGSHPDDCKF